MSEVPSDSDFGVNSQDNQFDNRAMASCQKSKDEILSALKEIRRYWEELKKDNDDDETKKQYKKTGMERINLIETNIKNAHRLVRVANIDDLRAYGLNYDLTANRRTGSKWIYHKLNKELFNVPIPWDSWKSSSSKRSKSAPPKRQQSQQHQNNSNSNSSSNNNSNSSSHCSQSPLNQTKIEFTSPPSKPVKEQVLGSFWKFASDSPKIGKNGEGYLKRLMELTCDGDVLRSFFKADFEKALQDHDSETDQKPFKFNASVARKNIMGCLAANCGFNGQENDCPVWIKESLAKDGKDEYANVLVPNEGGNNKNRGFGWRHADARQWFLDNFYAGKVVVDEPIGDCDMKQNIGSGGSGGGRGHKRTKFEAMGVTGQTPERKKPTTTQRHSIDFEYGEYGQTSGSGGHGVIKFDEEDNDVIKFDEEKKQWQKEYILSELNDLRSRCNDLFEYVEKNL